MIHPFLSPLLDFSLLSFFMQHFLLYLAFMIHLVYSLKFCSRIYARHGTRNMSHAREVLGQIVYNENKERVMQISIGDQRLVSSDNRATGFTSPKELLYSSLSSCTIATIATFYANSKSSSASWADTSLDDIKVTVSEIMGKDEHIPVSLRLSISLSGSGLSASMKERLLKSASFCPVKRMMSSNIPIITDSFPSTDE